MSEDKMLIENKLMQMVVEETNDEGNTYYRLNSAFNNKTIARSIVGAAKIIDKLRKFQPDDELRKTNQKLGADLLKSQMELENLKKEYDELEFECKKLASDLGLESEKQTRIDIMSKRITELESKCETYKHCFEFLAACKTES